MRETQNKLCKRRIKKNSVGGFSFEKNQKHEKVTKFSVPFLAGNAMVSRLSNIMPLKMGFVASSLRDGSSQKIYLGLQSEYS